MTNERAIYILKTIHNTPVNIWASIWTLEADEAFKMAIKALKERHEGKWIMTSQGDYECSYCRSPHTDTPSFCPWCGADMRKENKE